MPFPFVDDMVHEAKRQAIREIQQAVTAAELRANELVIQERNKMEKTLQQIRQTAKEDAMKHYNTQSDSLEVGSLIHYSSTVIFIGNM